MRLLPSHKPSQGLFGECEANSVVSGHVPANRSSPPSEIVYPKVNETSRNWTRVVKGSRERTRSPVDIQSGADPYSKLTSTRETYYEMGRKLDEIRRQLEHLRASDPYMDRVRFERELELQRLNTRLRIRNDRLRSELRRLEIEAEERNTAALRAKEAEMMSPSATPVEFQAVYNSSHSRDVTIHVELNVTEDIDEELEEFNRLTRIGNFRGAKSFFDEKLRIFMDNPHVFVQYAEMLLRQGDFKSIQRLDDSRVFPSTKGYSEDANETHLQNLRHNWCLIEATSLCYTQYEISPVRNKMPKTPVSLALPLGSTKVRSPC